MTEKDPLRATQSPSGGFSTEYSPPHQEVEKMIVSGLRKALKKGSVRPEQVEDYIQAYKEGLEKAPQEDEGSSI